MKKNIFEAMRSSVDEAVEYYKTQKKVLPLWPVDVAEKKNTAGDDGIISKFRLPDGKTDRAYSAEDDLRAQLSLVKTQAEALQEAVSSILDDNDKVLEPGLLEALDILCNQVDRFVSSYKSRADKLLKRLGDEETEFEKKRSDMVELLQKSFADLEDTVSAVYRGVKMTNAPIYDLVLGELNSFFRNIGVYTYPVNIGDKINLDVCIYADEGAGKVTECVEDDDCIYEILQLPYMLNESICLSPGKVYTWRFDR